LDAEIEAVIERKAHGDEVFVHSPGVTGQEEKATVFRTLRQSEGKLISKVRKKWGRDVWGGCWISFV